MENASYEETRCVHLKIFYTKINACLNSVFHALNEVPSNVHVQVCVFVCVRERERERMKLGFSFKTVY